MWFATETGVSRFDGVHFKNFTTEDGLPDNEIIGLFLRFKRTAMDDAVPENNLLLLQRQITHTGE